MLHAIQLLLFFVVALCRGEFSAHKLDSYRDINNREDLRAAILDGDDKLMNSAAWRFLNQQQKRLLKAGRNFWAQDNATVDAALDAMLLVYQNTNL